MPSWSERSGKAPRKWWTWWLGPSAVRGSPRPHRPRRSLRAGGGSIEEPVRRDPGPRAFDAGQEAELDFADDFQGGTDRARNVGPAGALEGVAGRAQLLAGCPQGRI